MSSQIVQLTASGNFEEALALCKLLPAEESSIRAAKESSIHTRCLKLQLQYLLIKGTTILLHIRCLLVMIQICSLSF